jgi:hypothetical protein
MAMQSEPIRHHLTTTVKTLGGHSYAIPQAIVPVSKPSITAKLAPIIACVLKVLFLHLERACIRIVRSMPSKHRLVLHCGRAETTGCLLLACLWKVRKRLQRDMKLGLLGQATNHVGHQPQVAVTGGILALAVTRPEKSDLQSRRKM